MGTRDFGKRAARRWTGVIAAAGIALTGLVGVGTYHALEASTTSASSGTSSSTSTAGGSGTSSSSTGFAAGSGASQTGSSGS